MSSLQITDYVRRPGIGRLGRPVQVRSNYFEITKLPGITIHHYDMTITPDVPTPVNRKIFNEFIKRYRESDLDGTHPVYDGRKNLFSPKKLPFGDSRTFEVTLPGESGPRRQAPIFKIKVRKAATINLEELHWFLQAKSPLTNNILTSIMSLDVLIRHKPSMTHTTIGRAFYTSAAKCSLAGPLEAWRGYYQSVRPCMGKMMINVDVAATAFFQSGPLIDLVVKILGLRHPDDLRRAPGAVNWVRVDKQIKGLRIQVDHRQKAKRMLKIFGLTKTSARETTFSMSNDRNNPPGTQGSEVTVDIVSYFKETYNITLSYPDLPCVSVGKTVILPIEVCRVVEGQRCDKKLDERQTADMIKFTSQTPNARANNIKDGIRLLNYDSNEHLHDFGMKVSREMATIKARVLPPPTIMFDPACHDSKVTPRDGSWNLKGKRLVHGATLGSWGVVVFGSERDAPNIQVQNFVREVVVSCCEVGIIILNKNPQISYLNPHGSIESNLKLAWIQAGNAVKSQPQLMVCILPNTGTPLYAEIKRVTDTVLGMKHTRDPKKQYCANVCLKISVKFG
ncbi:Eukaryotic translation initiation factor 2C, partial [Dissophora ornata]